nr:MDR family MFS transporter [Aneurinibacillus terranovensis]
MAMMVATFLAAIEVTVVSTAMPTIVSDLGGIKLISWVYAAYLLTTTVTTPIYGKLADLFGRKIIFAIGTVLFLAGSMLSGLSHSMEQLIWFRAFQGIGAGAVLPITFTIIGDIYTFEERAKVQGLFSGIWGIAGILGPLVGGFFVDIISWRWIFYFNVPFGLLSLFLIWIFLHENFEKKKKNIDYWGAITFTIGATALLYALLSGGQDYAWNSVVIMGLFAVAAASLVLFVVIEAKSADPMVPLKLFSIRVISISNLAAFLTSAVLIGLNAYLPMWVQGILGYSATSSGLTLTPMSLSWTVGAIIGGRLMLKIGSRAVSLFGVGLILVASLWLAVVGMNTPYWMFVAIMLIVGIGFGFSMTAFTVVIQSSVNWNLRGAATASNSFVRTLGQMLGVVVFGTWFNSTISNYISTHFHGSSYQSQDFNKLLNPEFAKKIPADVLHTMREVLTAGLHGVYVIMGGIALLALIATLWLPRQSAVEAEPVAESK